jgi:lysophospholipase L1-like esterase
MNFHLSNDDTVCFIGDSITHAGAYHKIVSDSCTLRWPERRVRWRNCGISGDSAAGALGRFDTDIAPHHPTHAFVLFGMNDGNRSLYTSPGNTAARAEAIANHTSNMTQLVARLQALGARQVFLISPTAYDQYTRLETGGEPCGYDDALAEMGDAARTLAMRSGIGFIDLHTCFRAAVQAGRARYVSDDRVHPLPVGHFLMAVKILEALELPAQGADGLPCVVSDEMWAAAPRELQAAWRALNPMNERTIAQAREICRLTAERHEYEIRRLRNPIAARMFLGWERHERRQHGIELPAEDHAAARLLVERNEGNPYVIGLYRDFLEYGGTAARQEAWAELAAMDAAIRRAVEIPARPCEMRSSVRA